MLFSSTTIHLYLLSWLQLAVDATTHPNDSNFLNITGIHPVPALRSPLSPNVSRDAPYILHLPPSDHPGGGMSMQQQRNPLWVFSDTETFTSAGQQAGFVSNSAAWDTSDRRRVLEVALSGGGGGDNGGGGGGEGGEGYMVATDFLVEGDGAIRRPWIPFVEEEVKFNRENAKGSMEGGDGRRIALWPNGPPTPINTTHAILYCTIIQVTPESPTEPGYMGWRYLFRGITLVSIVLENAGVAAMDQVETITARRMVPKLFTEKDISWGNFNALVGSCGVGVGVQGNGSANTNGDGRKCIYPIAIGARGLFLAKASLENMWDKTNYTYYSPPNTAFLRNPPTHTSPTAPFLTGTFSSGQIFFSAVYNTFLIIYFNRLVDNSFYIRYLDLSLPLSNQSTRDGITWYAHREITAQDVQAVVKYAWSRQYRLYETKQGKGGFSYAGGVAGSYFEGGYERNPTGFGREGRGRGGDEREFVLLTWTMQTGEKVVGYETLGAVVGFGRVWDIDGGENGNSTKVVPTPTDTRATGTTSTSTVEKGTQTLSALEKEEEEEEEEEPKPKPSQSQLPWDNIYTRGDLEKSNNTDPNKGDKDKKSEASGRGSIVPVFLDVKRIVRGGYTSITGLSKWIWGVVSFVGGLWIVGIVFGFVGGDWVWGMGMGMGLGAQMLV
ncbi:hypothetical protein DFH27DRAFT_648518 [Peziza echinospora]|nr:hypothetical protein DFH27DRAFT_648518 [Peziza echinospora]